MTEKTLTTTERGELARPLSLAQRRSPGGLAVLLVTVSRYRDGG